MENIFKKQFSSTYESCGDKEHNPPKEEELKMFVRLFLFIYKPFGLDKKEQKMWCGDMICVAQMENSNTWENVM